MSTPFIQVTTTTANEADARRIADTLIDARLAACVQIGGPITSVYRWQGKIETSPEWRCVIKTRHALFDQVKTLIQREHPYDVPQIVALPILETSENYGEWLNKETTF
ncbi:MAG: divalent-cation tolerance protein CutA [Planctomycetia bacterium]